MNAARRVNDATYHRRADLVENEGRIRGFCHGRGAFRQALDVREGSCPDVS